MQSERKIILSRGTCGKLVPIKLKLKLKIIKINDESARVTSSFVATKHSYDYCASLHDHRNILR